MRSDCNDVSCFQQISKKQLEFTSEVWVFSFFHEFYQLIDSILADDFCVSWVKLNYIINW